MKQEEAARGDQQSQAGDRRVSRKRKERGKKLENLLKEKFYRRSRKFKVLLIPNFQEFN